MTPKNLIGVLGPQGSYSEQALKQYSKGNDYVLLDSISEVILQVSSGKIKEAVLPFENSIYGTVLETLDGVFSHNLKITGEMVLKIEHVIAGLNGHASPNSIKFIYSHPQALGQCQAYIEKKYPRAKLVSMPSTSSAFKKIADEKLTDSLAIGSHFAAKIYGLLVVDEYVQDIENNHTRFVVVSKKAKPRGPLFTFLVIAPRINRVGFIHDMLAIFKKDSINLLHIESRPSKKMLGSYIFYLKADISPEDPRRHGILEALGAFGKVTLLTR